MSAKREKQNKNLGILTTAILLTAFVGAFAQSSADANLSVTINPIKTIQVNNANKSFKAAGVPANSTAQR